MPIKSTLPCLFAVVIGLSWPAFSTGQKAHEIWTKSVSPALDSSFGTCYFRKTFTVVNPIEAEIYVAAKDSYELFINGTSVYRDQGTNSQVKVPINDYLKPGANVLAFRVTHIDSITAGLAAKFRVHEKNEDRWRGLSTDETWKTSTVDTLNWNQVTFDDNQWQSANPLASVSFENPQVVAAIEPATIEVSTGQTTDETGNPAKQLVENQSPVPPTQSTDPNDVESTESDVSDENAMDSRFSIDPEFQVQQVMVDKETGSLIAMAFNEFGQLILSKEGGPLMLADVTKEPGSAGRMRTLCEQMNSCQGILPLNGRIYVTGKGPQGMGLYLLSDNDRNGIFEVEKQLIAFSGELGEHGPHGVELGPDGMIYVTVGNASGLTGPAAPTSPYRFTYEGDLVKRMEDPGGHAVGIQAPGGTIVRTDLNGSFVETVAGGLRNIYDLAFNEYGDLFLHDSDLETNIGMAWYRPTRIYHAQAGAELGWRSGWSKFPNYFADVTAPIADTGRGSPSGAILYQHFQFPARYHNTIFFADWSEGRILAAKPKQVGAGYTTDVEEFITGRPLNVTDLAVGTDGTLFFCTGGRGTAGGVYRIAWTGIVPEELYTYNNDFERVIRMPQPHSAWGRQATATLKKKLNDTWEKTLSGIASDERNEINYRLRAIDLLYFYGPFPSNELVAKLAGDPDQSMRARIASLCGVKKEAGLNKQLDNLIADENSLVRRRAAESYIRLGKLPSVENILAMLGSNDRAESTIARRLLERLDLETYEQAIMSTDDVTTFINGAIAATTSNPDLQLSYRILARVANYMEGYLTDEKFVDLLRVAQLALFQGNVTPEKIPGFADRILAEFPAGNSHINKQLAMIIAYLQNADTNGRIQEYFETSDNPLSDKLFIAMYLHTLGRKLDTETRFTLIDFLENAVQKREGSTYRNYLTTAIKQLVKTGSSPEQTAKVFANGAQWPNALLQSFFSLEERLTDEQVQQVVAADQQLRGGTDLMTRRVRLGIIAVLAESKNEDAHNYLRLIWQERPDYRNEITLGLAQIPSEKNWAYLVSSLPVLDDTIGLEVVKALRQVNRRPKQPRQYRELIEMGFRLRENGAMEVSRLIKHWAGEETQFVSTTGNGWESALNEWVNWYQNRWPDAEEIRVSPLADVGSYTAEQVLAHLEEFEIQGNPAVGKNVFRKANCSVCHRMGNDGATFGPDLSNLASRFSHREILESIIDPSSVVNEQYASKKILTIDGEQLFGMLVKDSSGDYLLQDSEGRTIRIGEDEIEEISDSELSSMPTGLLDGLSKDEILHLFSYLTKSENLSTVSAGGGGSFQQR